MPEPSSTFGAALALSYAAIRHLDEIMRGKASPDPEECELCKEIAEAASA